MAVRATTQRRCGRMLFEAERTLLEHQHGHHGAEYDGRGHVHQDQVYEASDVQRPIAPAIRFVQRRRFRVGPVDGQYPVVAQREPAE